MISFPFSNSQRHHQPLNLPFVTYNRLFFSVLVFLGSETLIAVALMIWCLAPCYISVNMRQWLISELFVSVGVIVRCWTLWDFVFQNCVCLIDRTAFVVKLIKLPTESEGLVAHYWPDPFCFCRKLAVFNFKEKMVNQRKAVQFRYFDVL